MDSSPLNTPSPTTLQRRPKRRWRTAAIVVAVVVVLGLIAMSSWRHPATGARHRQHRGAPGSAPTAQTVTAAQATRADLPVTLTALGTVTPLTTVTVQSQISGYLTAIGFTEGQDVKKGDFLAQVDPRPYQAVLEQYQGNLLRDQALLHDAQIDLNRYQHLINLDSISRQNLDTQAATVAQYTGAVKTDQGQIDAEQLDIDYAHLTAPVDGRVGLRQVDAGNYVTPALTNGIVVLTQMKPMSVIFTIPQTELTPVLLRLRQTALAVTAYATDDTTIVGQGSVRIIDNQIDTTTGTVKLRAIFANDDETLFPNQFVNATLLVDTVHDAIVVPNDAIQRGTIGTYVFLIGAKHTVSLRPVTIGQSANGLTQIVSGLALGDSVVMDGTSRLHAGSKVTIEQPATPSPLAPGATP